jgi:hypothetical protein
VPDVAVHAGAQRAQRIHGRGSGVGRGLRVQAPAGAQALRDPAIPAGLHLANQLLLDRAGVLDGMLERSVERDEQVARGVFQVMLLRLHEALHQAQRMVRHLPHQQAPGRVGTEGQPVFAQQRQAALDRVQGHGEPWVAAGVSACE